jgi:hypothetical protein
MVAVAVWLVFRLGLIPVPMAHRLEYVQTITWVTWCWLSGGEVLVTGAAIGWWSYRHVERHLVKFQKMQEELREDLPCLGE